MTLPSSFDAPILRKVLSKKKGRKSKYQNTVVQDYWLALVSREVSLQGRREVLTGKAKFGVFGDGKELAQIAMAKAFRAGDFRAGYYRDQTLMMALGLSSVEDFLAQMYGDVDFDKFSGGRQMTGHFATPLVDKDGVWTDHTRGYNISADVSCTAGQMARALGLAFASKKYREIGRKKRARNFSRKGNEVCFCTIGDASTSEGVFWETINAAAIEKVPLLVAVWDDGYGISVPTRLQTVKGSISKALGGFVREGKSNGIDLYTVEGYDYAALCITFDKAARKVRKNHTPAIVHVKNLTQQQGHSTSGSHERYKSKDRLQWEIEYDCIRKMEDWMKAIQLINASEINELRREARAFVRGKKQGTWKRYQEPREELRRQYYEVLESVAQLIEPKDLRDIQQGLKEMVFPAKGEILHLSRNLIYKLIAAESSVPQALTNFVKRLQLDLDNSYNTHLLATGHSSALNVAVVPPSYDDYSPVINGYELINRFFDFAFDKYKGLYAFGEDVGSIGDVNQGMAGLQKKYGVERVFDVGIREWTILGQGAGLAMRGLKAIAEIQYLDYLAYALPVLTDDVATLRYRSNGQQQVPLIVRTRGHRLEGIWHAGSPLGMLINAVRGMYVCVPRSMTQAAGMYNTLLQAGDPGIIIECLNGYRLKERLPNNIGVYTVPLGIPEILVEGDQLTVVTYGACVRYAVEAARVVETMDISVEIIDVQTLLPFDLEKVILASIRKTNKVLFVDEDLPGGASAYMMQKVIEEQGAFQYLDGVPETMSAAEHRTPYGSDGDYQAKPQVEDMVERMYKMVFEESMY